jgi:hypothetical protein
MLHKISLSFKDKLVEEMFQKKEIKERVYILRVYAIWTYSTFLFYLIQFAVSEFKECPGLVISEFFRATYYLVLDYLMNKVTFIKKRAGVFYLLEFYLVIAETYVAHDMANIVLAK